MDSKRAHVGVLLALSSLLFFVGLGSLGLTDRDEGSNAEAAREMLESGDWLTPTLNHEPRFAKPAFVYWLMTFAYRLGGVSEVTARLPSAAAGVVLILLQYWFLSRVKGSALGFLGAVMLLLNVEIVALGRLALTDSVLMLFTTLAVFGFWLGLHGNGRERQFIWLFYVGMALGTLTKGPVGVLIPLFAAIPYLTVTRRWREFIQVGYPVAGTVVFLLLATPWYAAMLATHGSRYMISVQGDTVGRFLNVIGGHGGTVFFYLPVLLLGLFPWSGFLPFAIYQTFQAVRRSKFAVQTPTLDPRTSNLEPRTSNLELFASLWLITGFLFFSLSATRLPHYIGPLFPAGAIVTAGFWHRWLSEPDTPQVRAAVWTVIALGCVLGLGLALSPWVYSRYATEIAKEFPMATQVSPGWWPFVAGVVLLLGMPILGYYGLALNQPAPTFWISGALIGAVLLIAIQLIVPRFSRYFIEPPQQLAYIAGVNLGSDDRLILYGPPKPSLIFYARRHAIVSRPGEEAQMAKDLVPGSARTMIVLPSRLKPKLPPAAARYQLLLERYGYSLLADRPMVELPASPAAPSPPARRGH